MEDKIYFLLYRVYDRKERPDLKENVRMYGWTSNKKVLRAFLNQRDKKKYTVFKATEEEIGIAYSHNDLCPENMISMLKLCSVKDGEIYPLFMTALEMNEVEKKIQRMFREKCSISNIKLHDEKDDIYFINLFLNLRDEYSEALHYIGYRPPEVGQLFPSTEYDVDDTLNTAYGEHLFDMEDYSSDDQALGISVLDDVSKQILYSLESFVKVMMYDL